MKENIDEPHTQPTGDTLAASHAIIRTCDITPLIGYIMWSPHA